MRQRNLKFGSMSESLASIYFLGKCKLKIFSHIDMLYTGVIQPFIFQNKLFGSCSEPKISCKKSFKEIIRG